MFPKLFFGKKTNKKLYSFTVSGGCRGDCDEFLLELELVQSSHQSGLLPPSSSGELCLLNPDPSLRASLMPRSLENREMSNTFKDNIESLR